MWASADPNYLGPDTYVPPAVSDYNANDAGFKWITPSPILGGVRGIYTYRTTFVVDSTSLDSTDRIDDPMTDTVPGPMLTEGDQSVLSIVPTANAQLYRLVYP